MTSVLTHRGDTDPGAAPSARSGPDRITWAARVAAAVAAVALVVSVVSGILWWTAVHGSSADTARQREDAVAAARQIAVNLQTLDYNTVDRGLGAWETSATGPLLEEFRKNRDQYAAQVRAAQIVTNARVIDAALSDLDASAGRAKAIASVDVTTAQVVNGVPGLPLTKQVRIQLELVRTPDAGWKADAASAIQS